MAVKRPASKGGATGPASLRGSKGKKSARRIPLAATLVIVLLIVGVAASRTLHIGTNRPTVYPSQVQTQASSTASQTPSLSDDEQAYATQQAIVYPGPVPTKPPAPGEPTPDAFEQLRIALRWTPYSANVLYLTRNGSDPVITFGVSESVYAGVGAANTQVSARVILGVLAQSSLDYKAVTLRGTLQESGTASGPVLVRLVYDRQTVLSHDWLKQPIGDGKDIYAYADSKQIDPSMVPLPYHPLPSRSPEFRDNGEESPTP